MKELTDVIVWMVIMLALGLVGLIIAKDRYRSIISLAVILVNSTLSAVPSIVSLVIGPQSGTLQIAHLPGDLLLKIDGLSAWFILIINFTTITGIVYGTGYLKAYAHLSVNRTIHQIFFILFHASMVWVCMFENGLGFLVSWELMSLSSLVLVIFEFQNKKILKAGINYMVQMHISVALLTTGFIWLHAQTGFFDFAALAQTAQNVDSLWIFVLLFAGFAIKAGFVPFHTWLPHAHPAAPSHVSGVMSGVIVKLGIYGIFRILINLRYDWLLFGEILLVLSVVSAVYGIANAAVKHDFKGMLAFCTIENIGIIGIGTGLGLIGIGNGNHMLAVLGFSGALLHTLNHSLFKSLLFFGAGNIYQQTHTRNIERLGGLIKLMPKTAVFFLLGSLAIGGLPPLNGFISEFVIYSGLFNGLFSFQGIGQAILVITAIAGLVIAGGISILTFTKNFGIIFLGNPREELPHKPGEVSYTMLLPQYIIIAVMLSIALFPQFYFYYATHIVCLSFNIQPSVAGLTGITDNIAAVGKISMIFLALLTAIFAARRMLTKSRSAIVYETWGCGYTAPVIKAQYTGRSFIRSFGQLFNFMVKENRNYVKIPKGNIYPGKHRFSTRYFDVLEKYFITPVAKRLAFALNYFQFIQNGQIQSYVLYGLFFVILVFLGSVFNWIQ